MRHLIDEPIEPEAGKVIDFQLFKATYRKYIDMLIEGAKEGEATVRPGKGLLNLCRSAVSGFAARRDDDAIDEVLELFRADATWVIRAVKQEARARCISVRSCNILYLPEEEKEEVELLLDRISVNKEDTPEKNTAPSEGHENVVMFRKRRKCKKASYMGNLDGRDLVKEKETRENVIRYLWAEQSTGTEKPGEEKEESAEESGDSSSQ